MAGTGSMNKANGRQNAKNKEYYKRQFLVTEKNKRRNIEKEKAKQGGA
jgi:hypothetical protein